MLQCLLSLQDTSYAVKDVAKLELMIRVLYLMCKLSKVATRYFRYLVSSIQISFNWPQSCREVILRDDFLLPPDQFLGVPVSPNQSPAHEVSLFA